MTASPDSIAREFFASLLILRLGLLSEEEWLEDCRQWDPNTSSFGDRLRSRGRLTSDQLSAIEQLSRSLASDETRIGDRLKQYLPPADVWESLRESKHWSRLIESLPETVVAGAATTDFVSPEATQTYAAEGASTYATIPELSHRYDILHTHAEGGLGRVSVARDRQLGRNVALKQIKPQYTQNPSSHRRFVLEAEVTGQLEHPGIVPVYSLASDPEGNPFYAMRFVEGDTLHDAILRFHCPSTEPSQESEQTASSVAAAARGSDGQTIRPDYSSLEFRQLLNRFIDLCNAIGFAHDRGIIHRDLKPANVMLGRFGETLVVDWGLARRVGASSDPTDSEAVENDSPMKTREGSIVGTPAFMSPEQASGETAELQPASDVYGLGAILFCILTGRRPFPQEDVQDVLASVRRGQFPGPREVGDGVPRPLDAICMKAMARDPLQRYSTARELAEEMERWLGDEPVEAWTEPLSVRAGRWMKRHRVLVTSSVVALVVMSLSLGVILALQSYANQQLAIANDRQLVATEDAKSQFELALAAIEQYHNDVTSDFLLGQSEFQELRADLLKAPREFYLTLTERLRNAENVEQGQRKALFDAQVQLVSLASDLGEFDDALTALDTALSINTTLLEEYPDTLDYKIDRVKTLITIGRIKQEVGSIEEASSALSEARAMAGALASSGADKVPSKLLNLHASTVLQLAALQARQGLSDEATDLMKQGVAMRRDLVRANPDNRDFLFSLAGSLNDYGTHLSNTGNVKEAEAATREGVTLQGQVLAQDPDNAFNIYRLAASLTNLAYILQDTDRPTEAMQAYEQSEPLFRTLTAEAPNIARFQSGLASTLNNLGLLQADLNNFDLAEKMYREAIEIKQRLVQSFPDVVSHRVSLAGSYSNFGTFLRLRENLAEAGTWFDKSIELLNNTLADDADNATAHFFLRQAHTNRARVYRSTEQHQKAAEHYASALQHDSDPTNRRRLTHQFIQSLALGGQHVQAVRLIAPLAETANSDRDYYNLAFAYALAVSAAKKDPELDETVRADTVKNYMELAVDALRNMYDTGKVSRADFITLLENNEYLEPLRGNPQFDLLLAEFGR